MIINITGYYLRYLKAMSALDVNHLKITIIRDKDPVSF